MFQHVSTFKYVVFWCVCPSIPRMYKESSTTAMTDEGLGLSSAAVPPRQTWCTGSKTLMRCWRALSLDGTERGAGASYRERSRNCGNI